MILFPTRLQQLFVVGVLLSNGAVGLMVVAVGYVDVKVQTSVISLYWDAAWNLVEAM